MCVYARKIWMWARGVVIIFHIIGDKQSGPKTRTQPSLANW